MTENISVAMAYKDRLAQLAYTLKTFAFYEFKGEIVICDDFSCDSQKPELLLTQFPQLDIKIVHQSKKFNNPCMAYNAAFSKCNRDILIIQNPECCWIGNIALYAQTHLTDKQYLSFACLSIPEKESEIFRTEYDFKDFRYFNKSRWYNHSKFRPFGYHFCAALLKSNLDTFLGGGFDEQFADGVCFDDDEFFYRVRKENFDVSFVDTPFVAHQWHPKSWLSSLENGSFNNLQKKNEMLFESTKKEYGLPTYKGRFPLPKN
jgi:hypothetical protein